MSPMCFHKPSRTTRFPVWAPIHLRAPRRTRRDIPLAWSTTWTLARSCRALFAWGSGSVANPGECGRSTQDDDAILEQNLGAHQDHPEILFPDDQEPPEVEVLAPLDASTIPPGTSACLEVSDASAIHYAPLEIFHQPEGEPEPIFLSRELRTGPPWVFDDHPQLTGIPLPYRFSVADTWDHLTQLELAVTQDDDAPAAAPCP